MTKVEERHRTEARRLACVLSSNIDKHISDIATALAEAEARGAREEREACVQALEIRAEQAFRNPTQRAAYRNAVEAIKGRSE